MTYRDFPEITIPPCVESWDDTSWRNDVTASSELALTDQDFPRLRLWVNFDSPDEREYPAMKKYALVLYSLDDVDFPLVVHEGDDLAQVEVEIEKQKQKYQTKGVTPSGNQ